MIFERTSIRTYQKGGLNESDIASIQELLSNRETIETPFGHQSNIHLIQAHNLDLKKVGTYGFVKGAEWFFFGTSKNTMRALIDFGYIFEGIILQCTALGFGTVWLAGTFKRHQFEKYITEDLFIPAISPIGTPEKGRRLIDKIIRKASKGDHRLNFSQLFFNEKLEPLDSHPWMKEVLEGVRKGPSASNKQPWRVVVENNTIHMFLKRTEGYGKMLGFDIQALDIGIALKHLECGLKHFNISFERIVEPKQYHHSWEYILSYQIRE